MGVILFMNKSTKNPWNNAVTRLQIETRNIYIYRYFSLILTSIFYLVKERYVPTRTKLIVILCITISAIILNYVYVKYQDIKNLIRLMVILETIGNVVILIPTGGLQSPYIWYSLNTVLITAYFLDGFYFYFCLTIYIMTLLATFFIFNKVQDSFIAFLIDNSNLLLSYLLIIFAIKSLVSLIKKLNKEGKHLVLINKDLTEANKIVEESMEHISSLYQSVHSFVSIKNEDRLVDIIVYYTKQITKSPISFLYRRFDKREFIFKVSQELDEECRNNLLDCIKNNLTKIFEVDDALKYQINNKEYAVISIKSEYEAYGVLGIEIKYEDNRIVERQNIKQIKFLTSLSSVMFERLKLEKVSKSLLISEEQNRIANEIHDSVLQRLFYVSCKVQTLIHNKKNITELDDGLKLIRDSIGSAMKDLREAIYSLSRKNNSMSIFEENIRNYLEEVSKLNDINIEFDLRGRQELINYNVKGAIYRILCESIGNAIRHGKSKNINISINIEIDYIKLMINDDGLGFNLEEKMIGNKMGLGIKNIYNLVYLLSGKIDMNSRLNKGTYINITIPNNSLDRKEKGDVV